MQPDSLEQTIASQLNGTSSINTSNSSLTQVPDLKDVCSLLQTIDFATAMLANSLKDPDKRQEIGLRLIDAMLEGHNHGLEFTDVKIKTSAGMMTTTFKFPVASILVGLQKLTAQAQISPENEGTEASVPPVTATPEDTVAATTGLPD